MMFRVDYDLFARIIHLDNIKDPAHGCLERVVVSVGNLLTGSIQLFVCFSRIKTLEALLRLHTIEEATVQLDSPVT